jgi:uncharacterized UBP type Zn finger protein
MYITELICKKGKSCLIACLLAVMVSIKLRAEICDQMQHFELSVTLSPTDLGPIWPRVFKGLQHKRVKNLKKITTIRYNLNSVPGGY